MTMFPNLAGDRLWNGSICLTDAIIRQELDTAGITALPYVSSKSHRHEVDWRWFGVLGGYVPVDKDIKSLIEMEALTPKAIESSINFLFIRAWHYWVVKGVVPLNVASAIYSAQSPDKRTIRAGGHAAAPHPETQTDYRTFCGHRVILTYHIDDQDGLNLFVRLIRQHGLDGCGIA